MVDLSSLGQVHQQRVGAPSISPANDQSPYLPRYEMAKRELARWYEAEWLKLIAERSAREREIERKFWNGDYNA